MLGVTKGATRLERASSIREASGQLAEQARRRLLLFGQTLDPALYDRREFLEAVKQLALRRPTESVQILIFDTRAASRSGHRLIELARQLTSRIAIRRVCDDDQERLDAFLVADERGFVHRRIGASMEAVADFDNPCEARRLCAEFEQLWERAEPDPEMRRLHL